MAVQAAAMRCRSGRSIGLVLVLAAFLVAGCRILPTAAGQSAPARVAQPCVAVYSADRCQAMLTVAAESLGVADDAVIAIEIAPEPTPRTDGVLETLGDARGIVVLAHVGGQVREARMCAGVPGGPACMDDPAWAIGSAVGAGYSDVTCTGEPPDGCASLVPSRAPDAIAAARPLQIERRVIAVPGVGRQEVRLGTATVPNGVLTVAQAGLADSWPDRIRLSSEGIRLEVRSLVAGRPGFLNIYEHGWYPGTEAVEVFLVFDVRHVDPGATIEIRNVVVQ
jgi:hypothetical protein